MFWLVIIISIILLIVAVVIFTPIIIDIDSSKDKYEVRFGFLSGICFYFFENTVIIQLRIAWWKKNYDLVDKIVNRLRSSKFDTKKNGLESPVKKSPSKGKTWNKGKAILKSFRVKKCHILFDTGDMPLNAILYPWSYLLSWRTGKTIMINFSGQNEMNVRIENSLARIAWAYISS